MEFASFTLCDNSSTGQEDCNSLFGEEFQMKNAFPGRKSPNKRRKIDNDGFVTPSTPDIPKLSIHNNIFHQHGSKESFINFGRTSPRTQNVEKDLQGSLGSVSNSNENDCVEVSSPSEKEPDIDNARTETELRYDNTENTFSSSEAQESEITTENNCSQDDGASTCTVISIPDEEECGVDVNADFKEMIRGMGQEANQLQEIWSAAFMDSKNFEMVLPSRINRLLQEALKLEQHLMQQKQKLKERLGLLGQTLQCE